ncbi:hypothetical protein ACGFW5_25965 [Streptomyces sp. NPDC048416]|uniref:hypothetical protein n=1 Tax=Streptomyces sp. NPDC048416 TaxID=3365546 RepID=UPI003717B7AE
MDTDVIDDAGAVRHDRFGSLPERIRYEDMTENVQAGRPGAGDSSYNAEGTWQHYSCLALDLGL